MVQLYRKATPQNALIICVGGILHSLGRCELVIQGASVSPGLEVGVLAIARRRFGWAGVRLRGKGALACCAVFGVFAGYTWAAML